MGISIQLYTIRDDLTNDFSGSIRKLAGFGYQGIESYGNFYGGLSAKEYRALLSEAKLAPSGSHANKRQLEESLGEIIEYNCAIGCPNLICSSAKYETERDVYDTAAFFNRVGEACKKAGLAFAYHNHSHEFAEYRGKPILDILMEGTDPALMGLELDVYWAARTGLDPAAYQKKWAERSRLLHCKDMDGGPEHAFADVGAGVLDFPAIIAAAPHVEWYVVEHDKSPDPFRSAEASCKALGKLIHKDNGQLIVDNGQ